jgi:hypothetical protein
VCLRGGGTSAASRAIKATGASQVNSDCASGLQCIPQNGEGKCEPVNSTTSLNDAAVDVPATGTGDTGLSVDTQVSVDTEVVGGADALLLDARSIDGSALDTLASGATAIDATTVDTL